VTSIPDAEELARSERETRRRGLDRILTFSDAVVAIATTLLVLPLVDAADVSHIKSVGSLLDDNKETIFAFALSFVVIIRFWVDHHRLYARLVDYTVPLIWVNFLWLFSIVFLPFPTELIGAGSSRDRAGLALYIGTLLATTVAGLGQQWLIVRSSALYGHGRPDDTSLVPGIVAAVSIATALVLALAVPRIGLWSLLLLLLGNLVERLLTRRRGARDVAPPLTDAGHSTHGQAGHRSRRGRP
jgi:uncharacterized membrane protein